MDQGFPKYSFICLDRGFPKYPFIGWIGDSLNIQFFLWDREFYCPINHFAKELDNVLERMDQKITKAVTQQEREPKGKSQEKNKWYKFKHIWNVRTML